MQNTNVKLHVKAYEATYIESLVDNLSDQTDGVALHRVTQIMDSHKAQRMNMCPSTAVALIDALLEAWSGDVSDSDTEQQIANDLLERIDLPDAYSDPMEYAKAHKNMPTFGNPVSHQIKQHRQSKEQLGI